MSDFQFWMLFATILGLITGAIGGVLSWVKSLDKRASHLEIEIAVLKAILQERKQ